MAAFATLLGGLARILPVFIVAFIAAVATNTIGLVPVAWHHGLSDLSSGRVQALALGAVRWITVVLTSLGPQALTGTF